MGCLRIFSSKPPEAGQPIHFVETPKGKYCFITTTTLLGILSVTGAVLLTVGVLSLIALIVASLSIYRYHSKGIWRRIYGITAVMALYFNVFVLVVQLFRRVPALSVMAPNQSEPPFQIAQLAVLLLFVTIGIRAAVAKPQHGLVP